MYSMKRTMWPLPRKWRAIGTTPSSLTPRLTTMLIVIGPSPAAAAASIPASTLDREADVVDGGEHLIVEAVEADRDPAQPGVPERPRLARPRGAVGGHRQVPKPGDPREHLDSRSTSRRTSGSPPVRRILLTPWSPTK